MYNINVDVENDLVTIELEGFWTESEFARFITDQNAAHSQLQCRIGQHSLLCDLTKLDVIGKDVAARITTDLNSEGTRDAKWIAIAVGSTLLKLQMQRLLTRSNAQIFDDLNTAREWLLFNSVNENNN
jgi:phage gp46-like protein